MKQFNLAEYLKNPSRKVVTRDGRSARIICTNRLDENYPVLALVNYEDYEMCHSYTTFGKLHTNQTTDFGLDLFFASVKKSGWINLYSVDSITTLGAQVYNTEEEAKSVARNEFSYISTTKIEWEE